MEKSIYSDSKPNISLVPHHSNSFGSANSEKTQKRNDKLASGRVLAIDFGESKVGLAMADMETKIAFVYGIISNDKELFGKLAEIIVKEGIETIVIGVPDYIQKTKEKYAGVLFGNMLKKKLSIEVKYQNEMFTTKMAQENIKERDGKNIARKDDQEAAKIILQDWLDGNCNMSAG